MCAIAHGAEAIERGNPERSREIAVRAASGHGFAEFETHFVRDQLCVPEQDGAYFALERSAIESAADFEARAAMDGLQRAQLPLDSAHVGDAECAQVDDGARAFGNHVRACSAFDHVRVHADAARQVVPPLDAGNLRREFVHGVDAFLRSKTRVRGAAMNDNLRLANALARSFQQSARPERRLQHEYRIAAERFAFDEFARRIAADLLVRGPQKDNPFTQWDLQALQSLKGEERLHDAGLHIENAGTKYLA